MGIKILYLSLILVEFLCFASAQCESKRIVRSSDGADEKVKFYVECPLAEDPMISLASDNKPTSIHESKLSKLLRSAQEKRPLLKKPLLPRKVAPLNKLDIPKLKTRNLLPQTLDLKPELPKLDLGNLRHFRNPLFNNDLDELPSVRMSNFPEEPEDLSTNLGNILHRPFHGRLADALNDIAARKKLDLSPRASDIFENEELEADEEDLLPQEPTILEKLQAIAQKNRKALDDARNKLHRDLNPIEQTVEASNDDLISQEPTVLEKIQALAEKQRKALNDATMKLNRDLIPNEFDDEELNEVNLIDNEPTPFQKLQALAEKRRKALESAKNKLNRNSKVAEPDVEATNNDLLSRAELEDDSKHFIPDKAKLLREKVINRFKPIFEKKALPSNNKGAPRAAVNSEDVFPQNKSMDTLSALAEKTKSWAKKVKKFINLDVVNGHENMNSLRNANQPESDIAPRSQKEEHDVLKTIEEEEKPTLQERLNRILEQAKQKADSITKARSVSDPDSSATNSKVISDTVADKITKPKAKILEKVHNLAQKLKDALDQGAPNSDKLRSSKNPDAIFDTSNINNAVQEAPTDMEGANSDVVPRNANNDDDIVDLTKEDGDTAEICKCIRVAFPEKFENGHFIMNSDDSPRSVPVIPENDNSFMIPKIDKISATSSLGSKLKERLRSKMGDLATMADESSPVIVAPPEGFGLERSSVERAKMADQGIRNLLEFVKIVDQVDQYITTKARRAISRLATVLTEDEDARIL